MQVTSLHLRDFGPHEKLDLNLRPGINGVLGPNGSGKSTILDALRFLFTNALESPGSKGENVRHGASGAKVWSTFDHEGEEWEIRRTISSSGNNTQQLTLPSGEKITKVAEIEQQLCQILQANTQTLLGNVFVGQGKIDQILFQRAADRLKEFQNTFGLDRASQAVKILGEQIKSYPVVYGLDNEVQLLEQQLREVQGDLQSRTEQLQQLEKQLVGLKPERDAAVASLSRHAAYNRQRELQQQIAELEDERATLLDRGQRMEQQLEQMRKRLSELESSSVTDAKDRLLHGRDLRRQLSRLTAHPLTQEEQQQLLDLRQELETADTRAEKAQRLMTDPDIRPKNDQLEKLTADLASASEGLVKARERQAQAERQSQEMLTERDRLIREREEGACHACGRPFEGFDPESADKKVREAEGYLTEFEQQELHPATDAMEEAGSVVKSLQREAQQTRDKMEAKYREIHRLAVERQRQLQQQVTQLEDQQADRRRQAEVRSDLEAEIKKLDLPYDIDENLERIARHEQSIAELRPEIRLTEERLRDIENREAKLGDNLLSQKNQLEAEMKAAADVGETDIAEANRVLEAYNQADERRIEAQSEVRAAEREVRQVGEKLEEVRQRQQRQEQDLQWVEICREAQKALRPQGLPSLMMAEYAKLVNERIAYYLGIWQSPFSLLIDSANSFEFVANKDGFDQSAARLSGGEKVVASTSFRLAMADTFASEVGLLVLDEPSVYLDKDNIYHLQDLLVRLKELSNASGRQILLVTHEESLLGFVDHAIEIGKS